MKLKINLLLILLCAAFIARSQTQTPLKKGDFVPNFTVVDDIGNEITLDSYKGKVVLLNFTATWCGPCWETYTPMDELQKQYQDDLVIISFHMDNMKEKWKRRAVSSGINFDVISIWDSENKQKIFDSFAPDMFPSFVLLDQNRKILKKWGGNFEKRLRKNVKRVMRRFK